MTQLRKWLPEFFNLTGLIWLLVLLSERFYRSNQPSDPELMDDFEEHNFNLQSDQLKDVVEELSKLRDDEEKRQDKIEAKAMSLISFTGLASAFVLGSVTVIGNADYPINLRQTIIVIYSAIVGSLFVTIVLAIKAIRVGKYRFMSPHIANIWHRLSPTEEGCYRDQARNLLRSFIHNRALINDKASFVSGAQDWFRNTVLLLVLLTFIVVVNPPSFLSPPTKPTIIPTATPTRTITDTPSFTVSPSSTVPQIP